MKIGYGTYGMPDVDIFEAVPRLRDIGYEMIEIMAAPDWPTAPANLTAAQRSRLRREIEQAGFPPPVILCMVSPCVRGSERSDMLREFEATCRLAEELNFGASPAIVTSTLGGSAPPWETGKDQIVADLAELAESAARHQVIFAIEPHVGGALDDPHKANWLIHQANHPGLKLNFDYSHFYVQGMELQLCLDQCLPLAVHTHIKDGHMEGDNVVFTLPGQGDLDLTAYFRALEERGSTLPVCVEVSGMVWRRPDYDAWEAAEECFTALQQARAAAMAKLSRQTDTPIPKSV